MSGRRQQSPAEAVGNHTLRVHPSLAQPTEAVLPAQLQAEKSPAGAPLLQVSQGPGAGTNFALPPGTTRAGRYRACELMLDDPSVSRTHAEFRRTDQHVVLSDLGSLNGTYHNRSPCQEVILVDGDEIWIGTFHAIFRDRPPPSASG